MRLQHESPTALSQAALPAAPRGSSARRGGRRVPEAQARRRCGAGRRRGGIGMRWAASRRSGSQELTGCCGPPACGLVTACACVRRRPYGLYREPGRASVSVVYARVCTGPNCARGRPHLGVSSNVPVADEGEVLKIETEIRVTSPDANSSFFSWWEAKRWRVALSTSRRQAPSKGRGFIWMTCAATLHGAKHEAAGREMTLR